MKTTALTILLIAISAITYGQTITLGNGTDVNSTTTASPVNIYYKRQVSHFVYTADEMIAAGITGPNDIQQIGFYVTAAPIYDIPDYTISMKHTNHSHVAANLGTSGYTTVKNPFTYAPQDGGWDMIALDQPFAWDGTSNIVIQICWSQIPEGWNPSGQCRVYDWQNGYKYKRDDSAGSICGINPHYKIHAKPQIRMTFETATEWTGAQDNNWNNPANWTNGVPDETVDINIAAGLNNYPEVTDTVECANLINNGEITLNPGAVLMVNGDVDHNGVYNDLGGELLLVGDMGMINNNTNMDLHDLTVRCENGAYFQGNMINLRHELKVEQSTLETNGLLTLKSDSNGTARVAELKSSCIYTLKMYDSWGDGWNGGYLDVAIDGDIKYTFAAQGDSSTAEFKVPEGSIYELTYTSGIWENENSYQLIDPNGAVVFSESGNPTVGAVYSGTANCDFNPIITGDVVSERYIDAGATYWRYIGSPVQDPMLIQFNDDFTTSGYPGSEYPNFNFVSVYNYDETLNNYAGYLPAQSAYQTMGAGEGFQIYCGDSLQGTAAFDFDLNGKLNQGPIELPVTFTETVGDDQDGWNLVSNPYASTIDWDDSDWVKYNMSGAIYIQDPDTKLYATYVAGAGANGGSNLVASSQAFWVRATGPNPELKATEGVKAEDDQAYIKSNELSEGMMIRFGEGNYFDEIIIRQHEHSEEEFELEVDATKMWGGWGEYPQFSAINSENKDLTVHTFNHHGEEWIIPLRAVVFANGDYQMEFYNTSEFNVPCMFVEDTYTGQTYDVNEGASYNFTMSDTTLAPRFLLHIGKNYMINASAVSCHGDMDGEVAIEFGANLIDYELILDGNVIDGGQTDGSPFHTAGLESGVYSLMVYGLNDMCNQTHFPFVISEPAPIVVTGDVTIETYGNDGEIDVNVTGGTGSYIYEWNTGDTSEDLTGLNEGTYVVYVTDMNHCMIGKAFDLGSTVSVNEENADQKIWFNNQTNIITVEGYQTEDDVQFYLYDMSGKQIPVTITYTTSGMSQIRIPDVAGGLYQLVSNDEQIGLKFWVE